MRNGTKSLMRLLRVARPVWLELLLATILTTISSLCSVALMGTAVFLISRAARHPPVLELTAAAACVRAFAILRATTRYAERLVSHDAVLRYATVLRVTVFRALEPLVPGGLRRANSVDALQRISHDVDAAQDVFLRVLLPVVSAFVVVSLSILFVWWLLPTSVLVLSGLLWFVFIGAAFTSWWGDRVGKAESQARMHVVQSSSEVFDGIAEMTVYGEVPVFQEKVTEADLALCRVQMKKARIAALSSALLVVTPVAAMTLVLALGVDAVRAGHLKSELLATAALVSFVAFESVSAVPPAFGRLGELRANARRLVEILDTPAPATHVGRQKLPDEPLFLRLENASVTYAGECRPAFENVTLDIPPGRRVAIVGPSGVGKTTLVNTLVTFSPLTAGSFTVNGVNSVMFDQDDLRRSIGLVPEDAYIFGVSLRDNLRLGKPMVTDVEIAAVLERVRLTEWQGSLSDGFDTVLGEDGVTMSGGQRRRFALARMLLADPSVLVLDEPTASVDDEAAQAILRDILDASSGRTVIVVTHQTDELGYFDEVFRLKERLSM